VLPFENVTRTELPSAVATTWLLVTMYPLAVITTPEPSAVPVSIDTTLGSTAAATVARTDPSTPLGGAVTGLRAAWVPSTRRARGGGGARRPHRLRASPPRHRGRQPPASAIGAAVPPGPGVRPAHRRAGQRSPGESERRRWSSCTKASPGGLRQA